MKNPFPSVIVLSLNIFLVFNAHGDANAVSMPLEPSKFSLTGDFRVRAEDFGKTDFVSDRSDFLLRVRPILTWQPSKETTVVLQLEAAKGMGQPVYTSTSLNTTAEQDTSGAAANGDTPIFFHQAYGIYQPIDWFKLTAGRQVLSYGDELIIGQADWNNISRSFDALRIRADYAFGWTDLFASKLVDLNVTGAGPGDRDFYGIYNGWDLGQYLKELDVYGLALHDATNTSPSDTLAFGIRAKSKINQFDYRTEWTLEAHSSSGYQTNVEAGYTLDTAVVPRIAAEYFYASADYNQLFPTAHKWLGYADVLGRRNVKGIGGHLSSGLADWLSVQGDYYTFQRVDNGRSAYKLNGTTALGNGTASSSDDIGSEVDLTFKIKPSKPVTFSVGAGMFFSGSYLRDQFGGFNPVFSYAQMELYF